MEKIDGSRLSASDLTFAQGRWKWQGGEPLAFDELKSVVFPSPVAAPPMESPAVVVDLIGGRLLGKQALFAEELCEFTSLQGATYKLPLETLRAVRFVPAAELAEFEKAFAAPAADADKLFLQVDGKLEALSGLVEAITATELKFQFEGQSRTLPRERLFGVVLAQAAAGDAPRPPCTLSLRDGGSLGGTLDSLTASAATISLAGAKIELPRGVVSKIAIRSSRVAWLSELKPSAEKQQTLATLPRPWRRDLSIGGKPLTLGGRTYEKGLGVAARTELVFSLDGKFDAFSATLGIDQETGGKGDCLFVVALDGEPAFTARVKGTDPPREINLPLGSARTLSLIVEPGADLDLADHADWADARLLRTRP